MGAIRKTGFFIAFIVPALVVVGQRAGGAWNWITVAFVFGVLPLADLLVGRDGSNVAEANVSGVTAERYYRLVLYVWVFVQFGFLGWAVRTVAFTRLSALEWTGFVLGVGLVTGGVGITVAHELGHKKSRLERFYALLLLLTVGYMHFYIEHNLGHHARVATPLDPATGRRGEPFYRFWRRSVFGGFRSAWRIERARLRRRGAAVVGPENRMIHYVLLPPLAAGAVTATLSLLAGRLVWEVPLFLVAQAIFAVTLLEAVNYLEHYGLVRREIAEGRYEPVGVAHSWNQNHLLTNFFLFQLQRHPDHHLHARRRYQVLRHVAESPQLPAGYPTMILAALVPPVWFRIIDPRLDRYLARAER